MRFLFQGDSITDAGRDNYENLYATGTMGQFSMPESGEFTESDIDKYVSGVRVYEDRFEWLLNLNPDTCGGTG